MKKINIEMLIDKQQQQQQLHVALTTVCHSIFIIILHQHIEILQEQNSIRKRKNKKECD